MFNIKIFEFVKLNFIIDFLQFVIPNIFVTFFSSFVKNFVFFLLLLKFTHHNRLCSFIFFMTFHILLTNFWVLIFTQLVSYCHYRNYNYKTVFYMIHLLLSLNFFWEFAYIKVFLLLLNFRVHDS
jgi:hypothetical protein